MAPTDREQRSTTTLFQLAHLGRLVESQLYLPDVSVSSPVDTDPPALGDAVSVSDCPVGFNSLSASWRSTLMLHLGEVQVLHLRPRVLSGGSVAVLGKMVRICCPTCS